jgi:class 3 adenylate cyclase
MAERALDVLDWGQVYAIASDVLVLEPDNAEASMLRALAERHGGRVSLPGRRQATALFADLVGSTHLAERHDVEIYSDVLRAFVDACRPAIDDNEGHVIDVQGDGIVACFGYPNAHEDDACRAVSAGLDMLAALRPVAAALRAERDIDLQVRVGVDTGLVVIDGAGVSGGTLNRAARLQSLAAPDTVLISATTNELVGERFETRALGRQELKGFDAPIEVFRVLRPHDCSRYGPLRRSPSLPFIGRDGELGQVLSWWRRMLAAHLPGSGRVQPSPGHMVLIVGGPGIGKSRLTSVVVERIAREATRVVRLYCSAYCVTSTLFPFRAAIESFIDVHPGDGDDERLVKLEAACADLGVESGELIPALGALFGFELNGRYPPLDLSPVQLQKVLLDRLTAALPAIAANGPAILVFEDLQWADPTTLEVLDRLAAAGLPAGLLILGTARPGLQWMPSHDAVHTIRLDPLPYGQACELAKAAGSARMSEQDARKIAARGDGVPLFVEQLAHTFDELGAPALVTDADAVPRTLIELLQARLDSVGPAKLVAQVAATIGRVFHTSVLEGVMATLANGGAPAAPDTQVEQHLKQLADAQLVEPMDHGQLRFRHVLMRDAAYQSQLMRDRRARHGAVAALLAEANPADSALTAFHFDHADRPLDALVHYLQAVRRAQVAGAFAEVLAHLARCEELLVDLPGDNIRAQFELAVRLNRGLAVSSTAGYAADPGVLADYNRARELCSTLDGVPGLAKELLKVLFAVWNYYCANGDFDTTGTICSAIERQLESTTMRSGQHGLDACRGVEAFYRYDFRRAERLLSRAVTGMARDGVDPAEWWQPHDPMAASCAFLGPLRFLTGDEAGALEAIETGLVRSRPLEFPRGPFSVAFVRMFEAVLHRRRQDAPASIAAAEEVIRIGERHGYHYWQLLGNLHLSAAKAMNDGSSAAPDEIGRALKAWRAAGGEPLIPMLLVEQADGYLACDQVEKANACLIRAFAGMQRGQLLGMSDAKRLRAELRLRIDPAATRAADADLREAIVMARAQGDVYSSLRAALAHRRLLHSEEDDLVDAALAEAVCAYRDAAAFPDLARARELLAAGARIRQG